ncbi:hypothetical protein HPG69_001499 [Diceros bicornis minor]|uniref:Large ribosomal subunit protein eL14 n=1 Tax=Diceros bicornis minor TaxID=77932 RepID=A0A7J7FG14_DICBM|nr:hypothetical protein HPG69_001499 [Diceros bicornis minor]
MEVGRTAYVSFGPCAGKLVTTVGVIDQNRASVDGPCTQAGRQAVPFKCMHPTDFIFKHPHRAHREYVREAWQEADVHTTWAATRRAKKIEARQRKAKRTDFDRYKVTKAKRMRNRIIKLEVRKLQQAAPLNASPKKTLAAKGAAAAPFSCCKDCSKRDDHCGQEGPSPEGSCPGSCRPEGNASESSEGSECSSSESICSKGI